MELIEGENAKVCTKCEVLKHLDDYHKMKGGKLNRQYRCKDCRQKRYENNKSTILKKKRESYNENPDKYIKKTKEWRENNPDYYKDYNKKYYQENKETIQERYKTWKEENVEHVREYARNYYHKQYNENTEFKIKHNLKNRINHVVNGRKSRGLHEYLGCTIEKFKQHLEDQFEDGMSWDNYGEWHVDHKRPCASFDLTDPEQQKECFHYTNTQPLWAKDNLKKAAKYNE